MLKRSCVRRSFLGALGFAWILASASAAAASASGSAERILTDHGEALVTVRYVLEMQGGGQTLGFFGSDQELTGELTGLMVDPRGILVCSNAELNNFIDLMSRYMGGGPSLSTVPKSLDIEIDGETELWSGRLLAVDEDLDLAWIAIEDPGERTFAYLDLVSGVVPRVGDAFFLLRRADDAFGRVPMLLEGHIGGITDTPRRLYLPSIELGSAFALPALTPTGELLGVTTLQLPTADDEETFDNALTMMSQTARLRDQATAVILPAESVAKAMQRALAVAEIPLEPSASGTEKTQG